MFPITLSPYADRDWEAIASAYAARDLKVTEICALHAISVTAFYNRARKEGWRNRVAMVDGPKRRKVRTHDLGQRLLDALGAGMTAFEQRLAGQGASATAADAERDARTLTILVRLFAKLQMLAASEEPARKAARPANSAAGGDDDADDLRGALALRLERLRLDLRA